MTSPAAIAVGVLRDNLRPEIPENEDMVLFQVPTSYIKLMSDCWDKSPLTRPKFLEAMTHLESLTEYGSSDSGSSMSTSASARSKASKAQQISTTDSSEFDPFAARGVPLSFSQYAQYISIYIYQYYNIGTGFVHEWLQGEVAIVMTDIAKATTLRELIEKYKGYFTS